MKRPLAALAAVLVSLALALPAPLAAFVLVEKNSFFDLTVKFDRAVVAEGNNTLEKNIPYKAHIVSMGDGSVRATFAATLASGKTSHGEARGIIAVLRQGTSPAGAAAGGGTLDYKEQKADVTLEHKHKGQTEGQTAINFAKLGFGPNSRYSFRTEGQSLKLEIFSQDGSHSILIGLLLPAVQKVREAADQPGAQKVK